MVRTEISLFLKNVPGELGKLTTTLFQAGINIDALTIQLFRGRGKSLKRIASAASYGSMKKDSAEFALIRLLVDNTDKAVDLLAKGDYIFDVMPVIALVIDNKPGTLAKMAEKFGKEGININYVYGSAIPGKGKSLFIFSPEDIEEAAKLFPDT
jgi:hypothetical protein